MNKPRALRPGDTIGLAAPSGAVRRENGLERAIEKVRALGYRVKVGESCGQVCGYLSGDDRLRADDLNRMFLDDEVDAIVCLKGGYGAARLLDRLDYGAAAAHPKILAGFSDITALHAAYHMKSDLVTFHAPMPASNWIDDDFSDFSLQSMLAALSNPLPRPLENPEGRPLETIVGGRCEGLLVGGNLSLVSGLLGTPYRLDVRGKVLLLEDIGEHTYKLDHMLNQLRLAGAFADCAGVVLGDFRDCTVEYPDFGLTLPQIVRDLIAPAGKPVLAGLAAGHCEPSVALPLGVMCSLDADRRTLSLLEGGVTDEP
ncbi:MAG: LD-carboxypeptidase [Clostridiales bacterium]|nr:LD-carboxypeptidase [Clostridiales bacterium]